MELFTTAEGWMYVSRWVHFLAGITWIGLLYYFNFVQVPFFAEIEAGPRTTAVSKLVPRALLWFRMGANLTLLSGLVMIAILGSQLGDQFFATSRGISITLGAMLALFMWFNVNFVIWPNQKVVIASAQAVAAGGTANPDAPARGRRAFLASRTNVVFSVPMLFFMGAGSHLSGLGVPSDSARMMMPLFWFAVAGLLEANALVGAQGSTKKPLESVRGVIVTGFVVWSLFYVVYRLSV